MNNIELSYIIYIFFFALFFVIISFLVKNRYQKISKYIKMEDLEVLKLREQVRQLEKEVEALKITINVLLECIKEANIQIPNTPVPVPVITPVFKAVSRPVLLVYGDSAFGEADRNAMRRAGVSFFRLVDGNLEKLRDELQRRRSEGRLYDVVHFSAHGVDDFIVLGTEKVDAMRLSDVLNGVRCVFLATCNNQEVADKMVGIVKYVVTIYEEINSDDAANFTYEFYKRYKVDMDVEAAFTGAMSVMPNISEFVDLRIGGK